MAVKPRTTGETALRFYRQAHERLLKVSQDMSSELFARSAGPSLHSVAWQLWHAARWDDVIAAHIAGDFGLEPSTQVWLRESVAASWSLDAGKLGRREAGTGLEDSAAEGLHLPEQAIVIEYARKVFDFVEDVIAAIPEDQLLEVAKDDAEGDTNLDNVLFYFEHLNRHLGMIEAIRGLHGMVGTATR